MLRLENMSGKGGNFRIPQALAQMETASFVAGVRQQRYSVQLEIAPSFDWAQVTNYYSTFKITGKINWVFTGIPRLMAGFTFGKSIKRALRMLSIFILS